MNYALIKNNIVTNIIVADSSFASAISNNYDHVVDCTSIIVNVGDTYNSNSNTFSPTYPPLGVAIQNNLIAFMAALTAWIQSSYTQQNQIQFISMYIAADAAGLTNRKAYIGQMLPWLNAVETYAASYVASIKVMTQSPQVVNTMWDFSQVSVPNPNITLATAISIPN